MLKPTYPLAEVIDEHHKDAPIREQTLRTYTSLHGLFLAWCAAKGIERPTLADLTHENALAFSKTFRPRDKHAGRYRERNALVALKALARWLAEKHYWYEARGGEYLSVLRDLKLPPIPKLGRKPFSDHEVKELLEAIPRVARFPLRERAIMTLQLSTPIQPDEVRRLLRRDFRESNRYEKEHVLVRVSKTEAGTDRIVPLDDEAEAAIRAYVRFERPRYAGDGPEEFNDEEPLFPKHEGKGFRYFGWTRRAQNLRRDLAGAGIRDFLQYRSRGSDEASAEARRTSPGDHASGRLEERGDADGYIGKYDEGELKAFPTANLRTLMRA